MTRFLPLLVKGYPQELVCWLGWNKERENITIFIITISNTKVRRLKQPDFWKWGSVIIKDSHSHFYSVLSADSDLLTVYLFILHLKHSMVVLKGHLSASVALKTIICSCVKSVIETYEAVFPCSVSTLRRNSPCWLGSAVEGMMM